MGETRSVFNNQSFKYFNACWFSQLFVLSSFQTTESAFFCRIDKYKQTFIYISIMLAIKNSGLYILVFILFSLAGKAQTTQITKAKNNIAYIWGEVAMIATANDTEKFKPRPTVTSRFLGLIWTAVFDAWSMYDDTAIPLYLRDVNKRPASERILKNKEIAISYAAYRTMLKYFFFDSVLFINTMKELNLDPNNNSLDPATAIGIGNLAAKKVIESRSGDGANEMGDTKGSDGQPYSDYTAYIPVNSADSLTDLYRWQPKYFSDGKGGKFAPGCLTPHWNKVKPLLIDSANQFRPVPPPVIGSQQLIREIKQVVEMQVNLTNEQKALVEFMRDGPKSVQQAGHWFIFAQNVSKRDNHN